MQKRKGVNWFKLFHLHKLCREALKLRVHTTSFLILIKEIKQCKFSKM